MRSQFKWHVRRRPPGRRGEGGGWRSSLNLFSPPLLFLPKIIYGILKLVRCPDNLFYRFVYKDPKTQTQHKPPPSVVKRTCSILLLVLVKRFNVVLNCRRIIRWQLGTNLKKGQEKKRRVGRRRFFSLSYFVFPTPQSIQPQFQQ